MGTPIVLFKHESPLQFSCGTLKEINVSVEPGAAGKGTVKLFITAPSCQFENGSKELINAFVAKTPNDELEFEFQVKVLATSPQLYKIILSAEVTNSKGEVSDGRIAATIDCMKNQKVELSNSKVIS